MSVHPCFLLFINISHWKNLVFSFLSVFKGATTQPLSAKGSKLIVDMSQLTIVDIRVRYEHYNSVYRNYYFFSQTH